MVHTALVTGGNRGIGLEVATSLRARGMESRWDPASCIQRGGSCRIAGGGSAATRSLAEGADTALFFATLPKDGITACRHKLPIGGLVRLPTTVAVSLRVPGD